MTEGLIEVSEEIFDPKEKYLGCTVVSLIPWKLTEEKPGLIPGRYSIPASDGINPIFIYIRKAKHSVYLDDTRGSLWAADPSDEVAAAICRDFKSGQLAIDEDSEPGLFWLAGLLMREEILGEHSDRIKSAQRKQLNWFLNIAKIADDDWDRYHKHVVVSDFQRIAAKMIGWDPEEHEWMKAAIKEKPFEGKVTRCIACNAQLEGDPVICRFCTCILKPEVHKTLVFTKEK